MGHARLPRCPAGWLFGYNTGDVATALLQKNLQGAEIPGGIIYVKNK